MIFITYPRSGVNFVTEAINLQTGIKISYQHDFVEFYWDNNKVDKDVDESEDVIITIVRDPKDSMVSWLSMQYELNDTPLINNGFTKIIKSKSIPKYKKLYNKLLSLNNVIFINYDDLYNINDLLQNLYKILNLKVIDDSLDIGRINTKNKTVNDYLITSKDSFKYKEYKNIISNIDLSECYDLYYKALDKCIKI
jgi:hypothetical protein